ncbi:MAG: GGDEF domain-containing protein [Sinimarinibacterium sp.]|jgi:diguanylate cyclase (GGDEF)-like protein
MHALSNRPDFRLLAQLRRLDRLAVFAAMVTACTVIALWLIPALRPLAPAGWSLMKFNTAAGLLLAAVSAWLQVPESGVRRLLAGRITAAAVLLLASATATQWWWGFDLGIDQGLVADSSPSYPGRMSQQTTVGFVLVGSTLLCLRSEKGLCGTASDILAILTLGLVLAVAAGYLYDATGLYGSDRLTRMSPQTLAGFACLAFVLSVRRARQGYTDVLVGIGIGSRIARLLLPIGVAVPMLIAIGQRFIVTHEWLGVSYASALRTTAVSMFVLLIVIWMARRINELETELRQASLTDELTGVHNRRGFLLLAEQALLGARRDDHPAMLYFVDIDGLKAVNDRQGHEAGSILIRAVAELLRSEFREGDIIGRIGGDEFCALALEQRAAPQATIERLLERASRLREQKGLPFDVSFSIGAAPIDPREPRALEAAMQLADQRMYEIKRKRPRNDASGRSAA